MKRLLLIVGLAFAAALALLVLRRGETLTRLRNELVRAEARLSSAIHDGQSVVLPAGAGSTRPATGHTSPAPAPSAKESRLLSAIEAFKDAQSRRPAKPTTPPPSGPGGMVFPELMGDPTYANHVRNIQRASWGIHYAPFLAKFESDPDGRKRVLEGLVDRSLTNLDVIDALRLAGVSASSPEAAQLRFEVERRFERHISETLGEEDYARLMDFERTAHQHEAVEAFERRLSYAATPLTRDQALALIKILDQPPSGRNFQHLHNQMGETQLTHVRSVLGDDQWYALAHFLEELRRAYP